ncbi:MULTISPECIES: response regulator transcription factor [Dehalococcoides]|uniref:Response regulator transcription factor n=1 Tax=Dehalococcoides mccartyi TaxID=61435 RepID=A0AB38ZBC5_9CHLR|nr:response regulator transcription factor [Dehalococcoides mccartyi]WRO07894.1 response regulator transcription factor [Dehalococcoides mccartyi]
MVNVSKETDEDKVRGQLSPREIEILQLASKGLSNREIADKLELSMRTVKAHLSNIFNKMRCSCRTEAIVKGFREGYVMLEDVPQGIDGYDRNTL